MQLNAKTEAKGVRWQRPEIFVLEVIVVKFKEINLSK